MNNPEISFIIPVVSNERSLDVCLLSILGQATMTEIEVLCVPISQDPAWNGERLILWKKRDRRVLVLPKEKNLSAALKSAMSSARGEYIMFMRQTDVLSSVANLSAVYKEAVEKRTDVCLLAQEVRHLTDFIWEPPTILRVKDAGWKGAIKRIYQRGGVEMIGRLLCAMPSLWGNLYRRDFVQGEKALQDEESACADMLCAVDMLMEAQSVSRHSEAVISFSESGLHQVNDAEIGALRQDLKERLARRFGKHESDRLSKKIIRCYIGYCSVADGTIPPDSYLSRYSKVTQVELTWKEKVYKILTLIFPMLKK